MKFRSIIICLLFICATRNVSAQKPLLNSSAYANWPSIQEAGLSNDGKYMTYSISAPGETEPDNICVFQSSGLLWKKAFEKIRNIRFSGDSKYAIFIKGNDSLSILRLGTSSVRSIPNVASFELMGAGKNQWLCYLLKDEDKTMILQDLNSDQRRSYKGIIAKWIDDDAGVMVYTAKSEINAEQQDLRFMAVGNERTTKIWSGKQMGNLVLDTKNRQLAFKANDEIWIYKYGEMSALRLTNRTTTRQFNERDLGSIVRFSKDGRTLFINLIEPKPKAGKSIVEIWSYRDVRLQSEQEEELDNLFENKYLASIDLRNNKIIPLQLKSGERLYFPSFKDASDTLALLKSWQHLDERWNIYNSKISSALISIRSGARTDLDFLNGNTTGELSPDGKYIVYFDAALQDYFCYEIATRAIRNITQGIHASWTASLSSDDKYYPRGIACWSNNDQEVLIYDDHDIWSVDLLRKNKPVNITNGYGLRHDVVFNLALSHYKEVGVSGHEGLILNGFNTRNKDNGFFRTRLEKTAGPEPLTIGPYVYHLFTTGLGDYPTKSKEADVYIVKRMNSKESANYFLTRNFKSFTKVTDIKPERNYNWLSAELHAWNSLDGRKLQGILYKPENFDPKLKYPMILYYYEKRSDRLNASLVPEVSQGAMDIPTYVSQGYLVFSPDIYYQTGNPMQGTYDAVISAAGYVSKLSYVNVDKIGIQGHSFGGIQTNYLVTHTGIFAAACSASGQADFVSGYGSLWGGVGNQQSSSLQGFYEAGQLRMGGHLWEIPENYIQNSPIFNVDKVTTPILIMHGRRDVICPYYNVLEFFTGLRRLGKRAWMLVYPEAGHEVYGRDADDFSVRMMQFFDHYLKDKPAPVWMTEGVSVAQRGLVNDLKLDRSGRKPGLGLLTPEEQQKADSLLVRKPLSVILK